MATMQFAPFSFAGHEWLISDSRAVFWPAQQALLVADLHLEKASWFAQSGQMLPPYDSRETLERLAAAIRASGARRVYCLGDNFHDAGGPDRLEPHAAGMLDALTRATEWVWITGNHDTAHGGPAATTVPGTHVEEIRVGPVLLRHAALPGEEAPEISGHFHPRLRVVARGRTVSRPCVVASETRLVLPAFGALTGGMDAADPAIRAALAPSHQASALVPAAGRIARFALWQAGNGSTKTPKPL